MRVSYSSRAIAQLEALYAYIADDAGALRAQDFVSSIVEYCEGLDTFSNRGTRRDDIRLGLRIVAFRRRVTIAFTVDAQTVTILGVFYGGQDYGTALQADQEE